MRILSLSLSACSSVKRVDCEKTEERSVQIFILYERSFSLVFWEEEWLVGGPSTWNFGSTGPRWNEIADFQPIFARSASAVTPSEKSLINTNRKSTRFPMSLRWSSYVDPKPPKGAQMPITQFMVIQGHRFWYQSKAHIGGPAYDFLLVINTKLPPNTMLLLIMSNFRWWQGVSLQLCRR